MTKVNVILFRHVQEKQMAYIYIKLWEQDPSWQFFERSILNWKITVLHKNYQFIAMMFEKKIQKIWFDKYR